MYVYWRALGVILIVSGLIIGGLAWEPLTGWLMITFHLGPSTALTLLMITTIACMFCGAALITLFGETT